jgi:hypothetical protein
MHGGGEIENLREGESQQELSISFLMELLARVSVFPTNQNIYMDFIPFMNFLIS